ncbi:hypothetical protein BLA29_015365 [Euroglyphus maynei]|uniref:Uncharacterized protein n=1 Tax=Euroglyphus maynei TaxID=6958 RepID=A0A1Y3BD85_EURMA|nr:hypothetical protein BLA29_015365 [Euroglyphus maynei]
MTFPNHHRHHLHFRMIGLNLDHQN